MLLVCDNRAATRKEAPPWMEGAGNLQTRDGEGKRWWGIGDGYLCGPQERATWRPLPNDLSVTLVGAFDPRTLSHQQLWCPTAAVADLKGRVWLAPAVLSPDGGRQFRTSYGEDWLPLLTPEQDTAEKMANAARHALIASSTDGSGLPMPAAAHWAAELLASVNHVSPRAIAALGLMDDALLMGVLLCASGLTPRLEASHG